MRKVEANRCMKYLLFALAGIIIAGGIISSAQATSDTNAFILVNSDNIQTLKEARTYLESEGGKMYHMFPPNIMFGFVPEGKIETLEGTGNILRIFTGEIDPSSLNKLC